MKGVRRGRQVARHAALDILSTARLARGRATEELARPRVHFAYLHTVPRVEEAGFRRLLQQLSQTHDFVTHSEGVRLLSTGPLTKPVISFSFDDGFASNYRTASILEEFGIAGIFFVPTTFIGTATLTEARALFGYSEGIDEPAMTWEQLEMLRDRGHEIGNHTQTHPAISSLSATQAEDQIYGAAEMLRERLGECRHFAWPFGRWFHFTASAANAVFASGHETCASAERGAHSALSHGPPGLLCLRRDHLMASWPLRHSTYFLARSSSMAGPESNLFPSDWAVNHP